jgi:hypothetical protein
MHLAIHRKWFLPLILCIGVFSNVLSAEVEEPDLDALAKKHLVYVEPSFVSQSKTDGEYKLAPYLERRKKWGTLFGIGYSSYEPVNYEPNFGTPATTYREVYASPTSPMLDLRIAVKRNMPIGSFGGELTIGYFNNQHSDPNFIPSSLTLVPAHLGAIFNFDALSPQPTFVPYVGGGGYVMYYDESLAGNAIHGITAFAPYIDGGVALGLDWLDPNSSRIGFEQKGLQASYLYLELRKYFASSGKKDPDFGNTVSWAAGIRVEL